MDNRVKGKGTRKKMGNITGQDANFAILAMRQNCNCRVSLIENVVEALTCVWEHVSVGEGGAWPQSVLN